jgi:hypothetical protein
MKRALRCAIESDRHHLHLSGFLRIPTAGLLAGGRARIMARMHNQTSDTLICPCGPDDYEQMAAVSNAAYSDDEGRL